MIRLMICDGDGTLELPEPSQTVRHMLATIGEMGIVLAVVSNASRDEVKGRFRKAGFPVPGIIVTPGQVKRQKPAPQFVNEAIKAAGVQRRETIYLGDDDATDMFCAINGGVLPLAATYSPAVGEMRYGLEVPSPKHLEDYLRTYGAQGEPYFGWVLDTTCPDTGEPIRVRVLLGQHAKHTEQLKRVLKDRQDVRLRRNTLRGLLFHYLVSQCYLSGLVEDIDIWTVYPGHAAGTTNPLLADFCAIAARTFRDKPVEDLLVRHTDARESKRVVGSREITDQLNTIHVNSEYRNKIRGKRILVLDDFTTTGHSLEAGRRMLMKAGAREVIGVAFAKYRSDHGVCRIGIDWDPFALARFSERDVAVIEETGQFNSDADEHFWRVIYPTF